MFEEASQFDRIDLATVLQDDKSERTFQPFGMRYGDYSSFLDGLVSDQSILQVDRADPLAAGFNQILHPIRNLDVTFAVNRHHISSLEPPVGGPLGRLITTVIAASDPGAAYL